MEHAREVTDSYFVSRYRTVYTWQELGIPGIRMFGKHTMNQACAPLSPHFHRSAYEFTFVTEGAIHFTTQEKDYELSGSDVFMTRPDEIHSTNFRPLSAGEIIWFQLDISDPDRFLFLSRDAAEALIRDLAAMDSHVLRPGSRVFGYIRRAFDLAGSYSRRHLVCAHLTLALYELTAASGMQAELPGIREKAFSPDIEKSVSYIRSNLSRELSMEELAGLCRLSVSQFKQKFRVQVGMAPRHYVNYHKIQLAKKMLLDGTSVTDTAMELGFGSSSYFTVVFRRYSACTPSEFLRAQNTQNTPDAQSVQSAHIAHSAAPRDREKPEDD